MHESIDIEVDELLKLGIIERSTSAYNTLVVLVKKKYNTMKVCINFRQLNKVLVFDNKPIPRPDMIFARLGNKK